MLARNIRCKHAAQANRDLGGCRKVILDAVQQAQAKVAARASSAFVLAAIGPPL